MREADAFFGQRVLRKMRRPPRKHLKCAANTGSATTLMMTCV